MPLSVNVGLSRKASKDFQSAGASINVTAELDQALLARPDELQKQIQDLYNQAESALDRRAVNMSRPAPPSRRDNDYDDRRRGPGYDRGQSNGGQRTNGGGAMTQSQRRAILSIADRLRTNPNLEARDILGVELDDLSVRQASELIDHLKRLQSSERRR